MLITYDDAKRELLKLAGERPDFVYERNDDDKCVYADKGKPSCIVGHVLSRFGVDVCSWPPVEQSWRIRGLFENHAPVVDRVCLSPTALGLLNKAQIQQDGGITWSMAVANAIEWAEAPRHEKVAGVCPDAMSYFG